MLVDSCISTSVGTVSDCQEKAVLSLLISCLTFACMMQGANNMQRVFILVVPLSLYYSNVVNLNVCSQSSSIIFGVIFTSRSSGKAYEIVQALFFILINYGLKCIKWLLSEKAFLRSLFYLSLQLQHFFPQFLFLPVVVYMYT